MFFFKRRKPKVQPRPASDRRAQYRPSIADAECVIEGEGGATDHTGRVADLTVRGVGIEFAKGSDPKLELGQVVDMSLFDAGNEWAVKAAAEVKQFRNADAGAKYYGFEFINTGDLYRQLDVPLTHLFNRRKAERVRPDWDLLVPVFVRHKSLSLKGAIYDITSRGMGIVLPRAVDVNFEPNAEAEISFKLPHTQRDLSGPVFVRRVARLSEKELIGVEFDLEHPDGLCNHQDIISAFVVSRMEELAAWEKSRSA